LRGKDAAAETAALALLTPEAVRDRAAMIFAAVEAGTSAHFVIRPERMAETADYVARTIRDNYPDLAVPYHSRWRHFQVGGADRWEPILAGIEARPAFERARIAFDLAVVSVLLDAGAGADWRFQDQITGQPLARSEGLAIASLEAFSSGLFSADAADPFRADAAALQAISAQALGRAFQVCDGNPLIGLEGRAALLRALGQAVASQPHYFPGEPGRVGYLFDHLVGGRDNRRIEARDVLIALLRALAPIWPGRITLGGWNLGDTWHHPAVRVKGLTDGLMPFHKLSQWLAYSLFEPLEWAGFEVVGPDRLTGLAEYRNGGLFLDLGVLEPKYPAVCGQAHAPDAEVIVEWRALTLCLLDRAAPLVRERLGVEEGNFPLAKILEGGTWAAGRRAAAERRPEGGPPIRLDSDGAVF
jgi:hypothetical protein